MKTAAIYFRTSPEIRDEIARAAALDRRSIGGMCEKVLADWVAARKARPRRNANVDIDIAASSAS